LVIALIPPKQLNKREFNELGFGPKVLAKIKDLSVKDQGNVYSNLLDDIAIERAIKRAQQSLHSLRLS
jgi:hypothetical protein